MILLLAIAPGLASEDLEVLDPATVLSTAVQTASVSHHLQPTVFVPDDGRLPPEGQTVGVRFPEAHPFDPPVSMSWRRLPAGPGLELRLVEFSGDYGAWDGVLQVRRDGQQVALFTHLERPPAVSPDGGRVLLVNVVERSGSWTPRARVIDLRSREAVSLPTVPCVGGPVTWLDDGGLITTGGREGTDQRCLFAPDGTLRTAVTHASGDEQMMPPPAEWTLEVPTRQVLGFKGSCDAVMLDLHTGETVWLEHGPIAERMGPYCPWFAALEDTIEGATWDTLPRSFTTPPPTGGRKRGIALTHVVATGIDPVEDADCMVLDDLEGEKLPSVAGLSLSVATTTCAGRTVFQLRAEGPAGTLRLGPLRAPPAIREDGVAAVFVWEASRSRNAGARRSATAFLVDLRTGVIPAMLDDSERCLGGEARWIGDTLMTGSDPASLPASTSAAATADDSAPRFGVCVYDRRGDSVARVEVEVDPSDDAPPWVQPLETEPTTLLVRWPSTCESAVVDAVAQRVVRLPTGEAADGGCSDDEALEEAVTGGSFEALARARGAE